MNWSLIHTKYTNDTILAKFPVAVLPKLSGHLDSDDKIGLSIYHTYLTDAIPFPLMKKKFLNGNKIAENVASVQQSKTELHYGSDMKVVFTYSQLPKRIWQ